MATKSKAIEIAVGERSVRLSSPDKIYFPEIGLTKRELAEYYVAVGEAAVRAIRGRPLVLKRYINGIEQGFFFQKRAPKNIPDWLETAELRFPSGRTARELVVREPAGLVWMTNLGNIDLNPHAIRADDLDHPDELRVDLDPGPGVDFDAVRQVAVVVRDTLADHGLVGFPKTSGSRGIRIYCRIEPQWTFTEVRTAAQALARDVAERAPELATSRWRKEERHGVFVDYNQNAKDRTVAAAYSVRPVADARVSAPLSWAEVPDCDPSAFTARTMIDRLAEVGDLAAGLDAAVGRLDSLLELAAIHKKRGKEPRPEAGPVLIISRADDREEAEAGLEAWRQRHPEAAAHLEETDILVDAMRGRSTTWTRIRVNLRNVPEAARPEQEAPSPDLPDGDWRLPRQPSKT